MSGNNSSGGDSDSSVIELAAAVWAVRSQEANFREADIVALTEWLEVSDAHANAYRDALSAWLGIGVLSNAASASPSNVVTLNITPRTQPSPRHIPLWAAGAAAAACLALAVCIPMLVLKPAATETYSTAKGERRTVALADGTVLMLNTGSNISVTMDKKHRALTLTEGEVAIQVAPDAQRPFTLDAADVRITDIGTEFNVLRHNGAVHVTVKSGVVSLKPDHGQATTIRAGQAGIHKDGAATSVLRIADTQTAFAWQTAHAIYRDQPLSEVVKDLNRYFEKPIIVDDETGKLRLTAILTLDSESSVVARLEQFLSLDSQTTDAGIVLRRAPDSRDGI